jgi:hypothetical protein
MKHILKHTICGILVLAASTNSAQTKNCCAKLLTTGTFHNNEVLENADKEEWFGLFKNKSDFYLTKTKLIISRVHDDLMDTNASEKTGWDVQTVNKDTSLILISGHNILRNHKILQAFSIDTDIFPGDTLSFNYLGIDYKLFATGEKRKIQNEEWFEITNYKLYLTYKKNNEVLTELLIASSDFKQYSAGITFAGDIDGDGFLDLLLYTSWKSLCSGPTLYLSKPANSKQLLNVVGEYILCGD